MAKKKTKAKFYAIKDGIGVKDIIVTSWNECSKLVLGYNAVYKSFRTEEEAKKYLGSVDVEKVKEQAKKGMEERKIKKETTRSLSIRLPKEMYKDFEEKCSSMNLDKDKAIFMLIDEWLN
ncbi:viroplasmin family protein [Clostridium tertium]